MYSEPPPRFEDIPEQVDIKDVLYELRAFQWEWRIWRGQTNGDLQFLSRFRSALNDTLRAVAIVVPVLALVLGIFVATGKP